MLTYAAFRQVQFSQSTVSLLHQCLTKWTQINTAEVVSSQIQARQGDGAATGESLRKDPNAVRPNVAMEKMNHHKTWVVDKERDQPVHRDDT